MRGSPPKAAFIKPLSYGESGVGTLREPPIVCRLARCRGGQAPRTPHHAARPQLEPLVSEGGAPASALRSCRPAPRSVVGSPLHHQPFSPLLGRGFRAPPHSSGRAIAVPVQWGTSHCCEAFFFISLRRGVLCHHRTLGTFPPSPWSYRAFRGYPALALSASCAGIVRRAGGHAPYGGSPFGRHSGVAPRVSFGWRGA